MTPEDFKKQILKALGLGNTSTYEQALEKVLNVVGNEAKGKQIIAKAKEGESKAKASLTKAKASLREAKEGESTAKGALNKVVSSEMKVRKELKDIKRTFNIPEDISVEGVKKVALEAFERTGQNVVYVSNTLQAFRQEPYCRENSKGFYYKCTKSGKGVTLRKYTR